MSRRTAVLRLIALVGLVGAALMAAHLIGIPNLAQLRARFAGLGWWAGVGYAVVYAVVYAVATLSPLPKSVFSLAAGAVFGLAEGLIWSSPAPAQVPSWRSTSPGGSVLTGCTA